jgi:hypothetical protein
MTIPKGHRFDIEFASAFPRGLVLIRNVDPDNEYQNREDKATSRPVRQKIDSATGKRQWKATVTDPDEPNAKRASFEITFIADVQLAPTTPEALPSMRPVELDGLTAEPKFAGTVDLNTSPTSTGQPDSRRRLRMPQAAHHRRPNRQAMPVAPSGPRRPRESRWRGRRKHANYPTCGH